MRAVRAVPVELTPVVGVTRVPGGVITRGGPTTSTVVPVMSRIVVSMTPPVVLVPTVMAVAVATAALTARAALGGRGGSAMF